MREATKGAEYTYKCTIIEFPLGLSQNKIAHEDLRLIGIYFEAFFALLSAFPLSHLLAFAISILLASADSKCLILCESLGFFWSSKYILIPFIKVAEIFDIGLAPSLLVFYFHGTSASATRGCLKSICILVIKPHAFVYNGFLILNAHLFPCAIHVVPSTTPGTASAGLSNYFHQNTKANSFSTTILRRVKRVNGCIRLSNF